MSVGVRAVFVFLSKHLCVNEDPLKADACFEHVGGEKKEISTVRGLFVCVYACLCVRKREGSRARRLMTLVPPHHGSST